MFANSTSLGITRTLNNTTTVFFSTISILLGSTTVYAAPTVSGTTISWPDDGWYQVQSASDYHSICEGGSSCDVSPGVYNVINLTTGQRFENIDVSVSTPPGGPSVNAVTVTGNVITWPDDGWYQVQSAVDYQSICEGGRSCTVVDGQYTVINHTTGERFENIVVNSGTTPTPPTTGLPSAPANPTISFYSYTIAEIFWDRYPPGSGIESTEVLRNGVNIGTSAGNSYYDDTQSDGIAYNYSLVAIDANGQRSAAIDVNPVTTQSILVPDNSANVGDNGTMLSVSGDSAFFGSPHVGTNYSAYGSVQVYARDEQGIWVESQLLSGEQNAYADNFGESISVDGNVAAITENTADGYVAHVYMQDESGQWSWLQTIVPPNRFESFSVDGSVALSGDTLLVREDGGVVVYRQSTDGYFAYEQLLTSTDPAEGRYGFSSEFALDADTAVLGFAGTGSLFFFQRSSDGQWSQQDIVRPTPMDVIRSMSLKGDTLVVGTYGSAVIYTRDTDDRWSETQRIESTAELEYYPAAVAMDDSRRLVIGFSSDDGLTRESGAAEVYTKQTNGQWVLSKKLFAKDGTRLNIFGQRVAIDDGQVFASGYTQVDLLTNSRRPAAYVFNVE